MAKLSRPRRGSLQFWPRKRARRLLPRVNWGGIQKENSNKKLLGFIGYKVGMKSAYVKDNTPDSMTKNKKIAIPVTIIECPAMKIFSVRFYKNKKVILDVISSSLDKELKRKLKIPKSHKIKIDDVKDFDDISIIVYSDVKSTDIKKTPDILEIAFSGAKEDKLNWVKEHIGKGIRVDEIFKPAQLIDIRGVTKGHGTQGAVKRFGIGLRQHKSEKGVRRPGSLGPWHPARVTFHTPMAGQMGMFTRAVYNSNIIDINNINKKNINPSQGFKNFGKIKTDYIVVSGSVQGSLKRQIILTQPLRSTKKQSKKNYELIELR